MPSYRVSFYNMIPDSTGHDHHVCQREIEISAQQGAEHAIAQAIRVFEQRERVSNWRARAQRIECTCTGSGYMEARRAG